MNRLVEELRRVAITTFYLWVCFGSIQLYRAAVLRDYGIQYAPWGLAALKALILAKFIMIGRAVHLGTRYKHKPLIYPLLHQSVVFVVMLVILSITEEAVKGFLHGQTLVESVGDLGGWEQIGASTLLLWLVLIPYLGLINLSETLGAGRLRQLLLGER